MDGGGSRLLTLAQTDLDLTPVPSRAAKISTAGDSIGTSGVLLQSNRPLSALDVEMAGSRLHVRRMLSVISICGMYWHHSWSGILLATVARL